jgi:hypothetical protein
LDSPPSKEEIKQAMDEQSEERNKELAVRNKSSAGYYRKREDYHDELTGVRHLAFEPNSGRIVFSMEGIVRELLRYGEEEEEEPCSWSEYVE